MPKYVDDCIEMVMFVVCIYVCVLARAYTGHRRWLREGSFERASTAFPKIMC